MKKLIFTLLLFCSCSPKILFVEDVLKLDEFQLGKLYAQMPKEYNYENRNSPDIVGYSVKITDPIFDYSIDTLSSSEQVEIWKDIIYYRYVKMKLQNWSKFEAAYLIEYIPNQEIILNTDSIKIIKRIIGFSRDPKVTVSYYSKQPRKRIENYYKSNCKIAFRQYSMPTSHYLNVKMVQEKLNELGYELEITNKINNQTKEALEDYQRKNDLYIGQLDFLTLKALGLDRETLIRNGVIKDDREIIE